MLLPRLEASELLLLYRDEVRLFLFRGLELGVRTSHPGRDLRVLLTSSRAEAVRGRLLVRRQENLRAPTLRREELLSVMVSGKQLS